MFDRRGATAVDVGAGAVGALRIDPLALPPGPGLAAALERVDAGRLDLGERVDLLRAWARLESWVAAGKARAICQVAALGVVELGDDGVGPANAADPETRQPLDSGAELVATALRISPRAAQSEVGWAKVLTVSCRATFDMLAAGAISPKAARVVCEETVAMDDELVARVERRVLAAAATMTPQQLRRSVRRAVAVLAPREQLARCERELAGRSVTLTPASFGMAYLEAYLPAPEAHALHSVLTETAHAARDRDRRAARAAGFSAADADLAPLDAYRADALIRLGSGGARELSESGVDPGRWQAQIVIDLPTAMGLADNPAELRGYGPIPGALARRLAAEAPWTRWIREQHGGRLLNVGRRRYLPSRALREFILARDQRCRFPGCEQPAHRCDLDHAQSWDAGGETSPTNLGALCRRHHRLKTHCDWQITQSQADGTCTWQTPSGETIRVQPEPVLANTEPVPDPVRTGPETEASPHRRHHSTSTSTSDPPF